jgi:hypothetical protein
LIHPDLFKSITLREPTQLDERCESVLRFE